MLKKFQAAHPTAAPSEILETLKPHIRKTRKLMNTAGGYWILSIHEAATAHIEVETVAVAPEAPLLLMSDGFTRLVDIFGATDDAGLYEAVLKEGPDAIAGRLRKLEAADAGCRRYARVKCSDDATCIVAVTN
jgi:serine/threonine protein phosphatase PrpC